MYLAGFSKEPSPALPCQGGGRKALVCGGIVGRHSNLALSPKPTPARGEGFRAGLGIRAIAGFSRFEPS